MTKNLWKLRKNFKDISHKFGKSMPDKKWNMKETVSRLFTIKVLVLQKIKSNRN